MDFINLRWILPTLLFVSVAAQANKVSTERVAGTTSYAVKDTTISKPSNTTFSPIRDLNPTPTVQRLPDGGLSQTAKGNLYIAQKSGSRLSTPVNGAFKFAKDNLKSGAKNLFKLSPLQLAGTVGLMGLDKLLKDHGWEPADDGVIYKKQESSPSEYPNGDKFTAEGSARDGKYIHSCPTCVFITEWKDKKYYCKSDYVGWYFNPSANPSGYPYCGYGFKNPDDAPSPDLTPVTDSDVDDAIDNTYEPNEHDWPLLFPHIQPDSFEIQSIPSVSSSPTITTTTNPSTGDITTTETKTDYDFDIDNSTSTPSITVTETESSTKYENGVKVDETTSVTPHPPTTPLPDSGSGDKPPTFELPSFCSWASVVCNWIGWTQEMPDGEEPDLSRLMNDYEFEQINTISFGSKQCPQPITLNLVLINKPLNVSFDAFCSLAGYLYFLVMASAYIIAARITLGVARG